MHMYTVYPDWVDIDVDVVTIYRVERASRQYATIIGFLYMVSANTKPRKMHKNSGVENSSLKKNNNNWEIVFHTSSRLQVFDEGD